LEGTLYDDTLTPILALLIDKTLIFDKFEQPEISKKKEIGKLVNKN